MTKTKSQKERLKAAKGKMNKLKGKSKGHKLVREPNAMKKRPPMVLLKNPLATKPQSRARSMPNATRAMANEYVFSLREPRMAFEKGMTPAPPDQVNKPMYRFATSQVQQIPSASNTSSEDNWVKVSPFGANFIQWATTFFAGLPTVFSGANVAGYAQWATVFNQIRCVAIELEVWNTTSVASQNGAEMMLNMPNANSILTQFQDLANSPNASIEPSNDQKGKRLVWTPVKDETSGDFMMKATNATTASYPDSNVLVYWLQAGVAQTIEIRVTAHWEAEVFALSSAYLRPKIKSSSFDRVQELSYQLNAGDPVFARDHVERRDVGLEMKTIGSKRKSKFQRIGEIIGEINLNDLATSAMGFFSGSSGPSFSSLSVPERLFRVTSLLEEDDMVVLAEYLRTKPTKTEFKARCEQDMKKASYFMVEEKKS